MSASAWGFVGGLLAAAVVAFVFSAAAEKELVQQVAAAVAWLLKVSFFDFVKLVIFIRPLQKYLRAVGEVVWLILVLVVGRYIIWTQPKLVDIPGPYIPMIGYVYLVSLLFMVDFGLRGSGKAQS
jgi:hypothetical protein